MPDLNDRSEMASYVCQECGCIITDQSKGAMLRGGRWQYVRKTGKQIRSVAYWMNTLYSPFTRFTDVAKEWLLSQDDPDRLHMDEVQSHYSPSSLEKRDKWMESVDKQLADTNEWRSSISGQLAENNAITLSILIENKRSEILNFASYVIKDENPVTHEQFRRTFKVYDEYEAILNKNNMTNGEINTAIRIIRESYETHLRNQTFVEDTRWKH